MFFPSWKLARGELWQIYTNTYSPFSKLLDNKWVLAVDLKVVTNKDKSNNIHDICHFEENVDKLFQEKINIDASLAALLEFLKLVCFT